MRLLLNNMHVNSARPFIRIFNLKFDLLILAQSVKVRFNKARLVEKHLAAVCIRNKPKPSIAHQFLYFTFMHILPPYCRELLYPATALLVHHYLK